MKIKEHINPDLFGYELAEPLPSPRQAVKLEQYREMGCAVDYNEPRWITEEKEKMTNFMKYHDKQSVLDNVNKIEHKKEKKEVLTKKFSFNIK